VESGHGQLGENLRKIGDVDEGVVERGEDASNTENELTCAHAVSILLALAGARPARLLRYLCMLTLTGLRTELDVLLRSAHNLSLGGHFEFFVVGCRAKCALIDQSQLCAQLEKK